MRIIEQAEGLRVDSPAKLNLYLAVLDRRTDGFHSLETIMVRLKWFDTLHATARRDGQITLAVQTKALPRPLRPIPTDASNLVVRAAELLRSAAGCGLGADLSLMKRIPAEAGLAGGSGNAAATLLLLNRLWDLGLPMPQLQELAARLGSDIPFFFDPASAAIARGRGELLESLPLGGRLHFVVVKPKFGLGTAEVYRTHAALAIANPAATPDPLLTDCGPLSRLLETGRFAGLGRHLRNDLAAAANVLEPQLPEIIRQMSEVCSWGAMMTGSGSACFGICPTARAAAVAAARLRAANIGTVIATMSA